MTDYEPKTEAGREFVSEKDKKKRIALFVKAFTPDSNRKSRRAATKRMTKVFKDADL